jgi:hypothetical protein
MWASAVRAWGCWRSADTPASARACLAGEGGVEVLAVVDGLGACCRRQNSDRPVAVQAESADGVVGGDDHGGGAFADRAALEASEGTADPGRGEHVVEGTGLAALGVGVERAVAAAS